jgi:hypothetical protein
MVPARETESKKARYATSRLSPLDRRESNVGDGDLDASLLAVMQLCGLKCARLT